MWFIFKRFYVLIEFLPVLKNSKRILFEIGTRGQQKLFIVLNTLWLQTFPDYVGHFGASWWPLWIIMEVWGEGSTAFLAVSEWPL